MTIRPRCREGLAGLLLAMTAAGCASTPTGRLDEISIDRFVKIRWPGSIRLAPDQSLYYIHDPDGIRQLYRVPPGKTQADAVKLTEFRDGIGGYSLSDDGRWVAITASVGGSEQSDLYLLDTATDRIETLLADPDIVFEGVQWRRDSKAFAYHANDVSRADFHIYLYDIDTRSHRKVWADSGSNSPADFNADGTKLVVGKYHSASYAQLFEVTLATGDVREITPKGERWSFSPVGYTADERRFLVTTDYHRDLTGVFSIELDSGRVSPILPELADREIDFATMNPERTVLAVGVNDEGYGTLRLFRAGDFAPMQTPAIEKGIVGNIDFVGSFMLYALNNANTPGIVYRWDMARPDAPAVALTSADTQGIDLSRFRLPQLVHYPSFDGTMIPAFLYVPPDYRAGSKIPFIVEYHGGPEGQYRPYFNRVFQYLLARGYGVMAPNVRGSSGYGKAYLEADNYKNRPVSVQDGVWAAKYLVDQGYADQRRIGAWGGSYGGFMVMAVITEAPDLFGAACNVVGIVNFETFLQQTKDYRRALREAEYGPLSDPDFLRSISPIYQVDRIDTPLMLAHGLNDPRVPVGEAMQIAVALKRRGQAVEELYFPDEGHGFRKEANRLLYYEQAARFFDEHLR